MKKPLRFTLSRKQKHKTRTVHLMSVPFFSDLKDVQLAEFTF